MDFDEEDEEEDPAEKALDLFFCGNHLLLASPL